MQRDQTELVTNEAIHIKRYSVYVCCLVIQHVNRVCRILLSPVACLTLPFFPHYLINGKIFRGGEVIEHKMCFRFLYIHVKRFSFQEEFSETLP